MSVLKILLILSLLMLYCCIGYSDQQIPNSLQFLEKIDLASKNSELSEPSGIALDSFNKTLWIVSDNSDLLFQYNLQNKSVIQSHNVVSGLEGITFSPMNDLYIVQEDDNEIFWVNSDANIVERRKIEDMEGYSRVAKFFDSNNNKGLEGIALGYHDLFVMKEGFPGVLIQISRDLKAIKNFVVLNKDNGFTDDNTASEKIDFSGICYDEYRDVFWITSDKAERVYLYSLKENRVIQNFSLEYKISTDSPLQHIDKAEGVVIDHSNQKLYIVSDSEACLYVFQIQS